MRLFCLFVCCYRYMEMDQALYDKCSREYAEKQKKLDQEREAAATKWKSILDQAVAAGIDVHNL